MTAVLEAGDGTLVSAEGTGDLLADPWRNDGSWDIQREPSPSEPNSRSRCLPDRVRLPFPPTQPALPLLGRPGPHPISEAELERVGILTTPAAICTPALGLSFSKLALRDELLDVVHKNQFALSKRRSPAAERQRIGNRESGGRLAELLKSLPHCRCRFPAEPGHGFGNHDRGSEPT